MPSWSLFFLVLHATSPAFQHNHRQCLPGVCFSWCSMLPTQLSNKTIVNAFLEFVLLGAPCSWPSFPTKPLSMPSLSLYFLMLHATSPAFQHNHHQCLPGVSFSWCSMQLAQLSNITMVNAFLEFVFLGAPCYWPSFPT